MTGPIGSATNTPPTTDRLREQQAAGTTPAVTPVPQSSGSEFTGASGGVKAGFKVGSGKGIGGEVKIEGGGDTSGGPYVGGNVKGAGKTSKTSGSMEIGGRLYFGEKTDELSRLEAKFQYELREKGGSAGGNTQFTWDNDPKTPDVSGRVWGKAGGQTWDTTGSSSEKTINSRLEMDGEPKGVHLGLLGSDQKLTFSPEGVQIDRSDYIGAGAYWGRDVTSSLSYDPPAADIKTTNKLGVGIGRAGLYGSMSGHEKLDQSWALDVDPRYRDTTPGTVDNLTREKAVASHAQLSLPPRSAEVLHHLDLGTREAYLSHIEETVAATKLPADVVVERMHIAVHQAGVALEADPGKSAAEAFAEQPAIDRRSSMEQALSQGLSPAEALDVALARTQGDLRPNQDILNRAALGGVPTTADFADNAIAFEGHYSEATGADPNFDAIVAAGNAHRAGDMRSAGALVTDYHDNGKIDGSNLVSVSFGDETHTVLPGGGVQMVSQPDGTLAPVNAMRPETAKALVSMVDTAQKQDQSVKTDIAKAVFHDARQRGASFDEQRSLYHETRNAQEYKGDNRNADALIADSRDNGAIDGSNLPEATIGDRTYAVSTGGGLMHGRTTMTPSEIAARANAHAAFGGEAVSGVVAKAQADAMSQSLRDGFSSRDQIEITIPTSTSPGEVAAIRGSLPELNQNLNSQVTSDGPDMRGKNVAYGRGTIENGPGGKNVSYDSLSDWGNDMRDFISGNGPREGLATPNEAETERQEAEEKAEKEAAEKKERANKHEGGENRGQQGPSENEQREFGGSASDYAGSGGLL